MHLNKPVHSLEPAVLVNPLLSFPFPGGLVSHGCGCWYFGKCAAVLRLAAPSMAWDGICLTA